MKIGVSTAVKTKDDNWDRLNSFINSGYRHIEFYNKITRIRLADATALRDLKKTETHNLFFPFNGAGFILCR